MRRLQSSRIQMEQLALDRRKDIVFFTEGKVEERFEIFSIICKCGSKKEGIFLFDGFYFLCTRMRGILRVMGHYHLAIVE